MLLLKKMKNNYVWDKIYEKNNFKISCRMIDNLLKNKALLYSYYPIVRILEKNKIIAKKSIELGAGTGQISLILKKLGLIDEVYLVDIEKSALDIAKRLFEHFGEKCTIINEDLFKLNFPKKSFDLCFSGGLIEHFKHQKQDEVIKAHAKLAKNIIFQFPFNSLTYWAIRTVITLKNYGKWPFGYEKPLSLNKAEDLFKKNKLKILATDYHYLLPAIFSRTRIIPKKEFYSPQKIPFFKMDCVILCTEN